VDSLTLSPKVLAFALDTFGPERIVLGSDYPFFGTFRPIQAPPSRASHSFTCDTCGLHTPPARLIEGRREAAPRRRSCRHI